MCSCQYALSYESFSNSRDNVKERIGEYISMKSQAGRN